MSAQEASEFWEVWRCEPETVALFERHYPDEGSVLAISFAEAYAAHCTKEAESKLAAAEARQQEIRQLLRDFALAESTRIANGTSANKEQWDRRLRRIAELGII